MQKCVHFSWKDSNFRIFADHPDVVKAAVIEQRSQLEAYIQNHPGFATALAPVPPGSAVPEVAQRMHRASLLTGLGPMAAVAGTLAQLSVEAAVAAGMRRVLVDNGGDLCLFSPEPVVVGFFAGVNAAADKLALRVECSERPVAVCSSSSRMGHSLSFGNCDLATVVGTDAAAVDAAATLAGNLVKTEADVEEALERVEKIPGVDGVIIFQGEAVGIKGRLPQLVRSREPDLEMKVTKDRQSNFGAATRRRSRSGRAE